MDGYRCAQDSTRDRRGWADAKADCPRHLSGRDQIVERPRARRVVALRDLGPVHHVPPGGEVIGATVLVFQVIGVLPHIVAEQHAAAVHHRRVLIGPVDHRKLPRAIDAHHRPAGAELRQAGAVDRLLQLVERAEVAVDRRAKFAARACRPCRPSPARTSNGSRGRRRCCAPRCGSPPAVRQACPACRAAPWLPPAGSPSPPHSGWRHRPRDAGRGGSAWSVRRCAARSHPAHRAAAAG